jgi:hypothetical protein
VKKRKLLTASEARVDSILRRRLWALGYRIQAKVRLSDVIDKEPDEWLDETEFQYLSKAHFDFLVVNDAADPIVVVEFDGQHHVDPEQVVRDVLKNRLCMKADVPLLRIRAPEMAEHDETTVLEHMLQRFVAWHREKDRIKKRREEWAAFLDPNRPEQTDFSAIPRIEFNERHPFRATVRIKSRLLRCHGIADISTPPALRANASMICDVNYAGSGPDENSEEFFRVTMRASVKRLGSEDKVLFSTERWASIRSWLPTNLLVPRTVSISESSTVEELQEAEQLLRWRFENMYFPSLPGISAHDIAEDLAEYLALSAVEKWAGDRHQTVNSGPASAGGSR